MRKMVRRAYQAIARCVDFLMNLVFVAIPSLFGGSVQTPPGTGKDDSAAR